MQARFSTLAFVFICASIAGAQESWPQFRGPNSSGVSPSTGLPVEFGPKKNVLWKTELPPGHSSPIFSKDSIFVTAVDHEKLFAIAIDRKTGRVQWRREVPRPRTQEVHKANGPVSPSAVTDGKNVYAFFPDFGLVSYGPDGNERWKVPMGPFNNPMGMGASPVLAGDILLLVCDQEAGSYMLGIDKNTGKQRWRVDRADFTRGFSTPVMYQPKDGPLQAMVAGSYQLVSYDVRNGKPVWWLRGLTWQLKPTPVVGDGLVFIQGWAGGSDTGQQEDIPAFEEILKIMDRNQDGKLEKAEVTDEKITKEWRSVDLDDDGSLDGRDWRLYQSRRKAQNGLIAVRPGGKGDLTDSSLVWRYSKSLPNVPSPLYYKGLLFMLKEGGILTSFEAVSGKMRKQGRIQGALDPYFASPVAADGKIFTVSQQGKAAVISAEPEWNILAVNDLEEECHATPAIVDGKLYIRTKSALYCFGGNSALAQR
ncbi:MAG: PQQ-binding-like beta-propeller repeat protein [Bryobacteraceae bacterium]